ncbi:MAG: ATP synthase subunit I [Pseudomonadota bacterium]
MRSRAVPVRIVMWQALIGVLGALIWLFDSPAAAFAGLAGGLGSALLTLQAAARVLSRPDSAPPQAIVAAFYRAEIFKILGAALMFGVVAKFFASQFIPFASVFFATLTVYGAAIRWTISDDVNGDKPTVK